MSLKSKVCYFYEKHPNAFVFWLLFFAIYLPLFPFLFLSLFLTVFIFWPFQYYDVPIDPVIQQDVIVIAHGLKDSDKTWAAELKEILSNKEQPTQILAIDWSEYAQNAFTCAVNGRRVGQSIAKRLIDSGHLNSVTVIGHSCGAFVSYGICETVKNQRLDVSINSIYLAPVSIYGGIFWNFGYEYFGDCADDSFTYYDTEDRVPGSNVAPIHSQGIDVTPFKELYDYQGSPHLWPIYYYMEINKAHKQSN